MRPTAGFVLTAGVMNDSCTSSVAFFRLAEERHDFPVLEFGFDHGITFDVFVCNQRWLKLIDKSL